MERLSIEVVENATKTVNIMPETPLDKVVGDCMKDYLEYRKAEEQGLLLRLPCDYNESLFWVVRGHIKEVWFKGIRCDKGYKPQIIARYLEGLSSKEEPITKLENIGKTVFLTREEAEQALKQMGE